MILMHMQVSELMFKSSLGKRTVIKSKNQFKKGKKNMNKFDLKKNLSKFRGYIVLVY